METAHMCLRALRPQICAVLLAANAMGGPGDEATAPAAPGAAPSTPTVLEAADAERVRLATATRLARMGSLYVRTIQDPTTDDFRASAIMLREARRLAPRDQEILRREIEAWDAAGDEGRTIDATRDLLALDPRDTVAQLRLITFRIRAQQDAQSRLALYENLLGPQGAKIDASVRSRLALDDAMLAREMGDDARFSERLTMAARLDPSNKNAAALATAFALPQTTDPLSRVELLVNVLLADPLDSSAHLALARELMSHGAFQAAARFYDCAAQLYQGSGAVRESEVRAEMTMMGWALDGAEAQIDRLGEDEKTVRYLIAQQKEARSAAGHDVSEIPDYPPVPAIERVRLIAASAVDRREDAASALERLAADADDRLDAILNRLKEGEMGEEEALGQGRAARSDLLWLRLWTGQEAEKAALELAELSEHLTDDARRRYEGWLAIRTGETARGVELLTPIAESDPLARLGLGVAAEAVGDTRAAIAEYARVVRSEPGAQPFPAPPVGLWARSRLERLLGEKVSEGATARSLNEYALRLPKEIDAMTVSPRAFMHMQATQSPTSCGALDRSEVVLALRNIGSIPLAVGAEAPLNSSFLLAPRLMKEGVQIIQGSRPEVVSLDRRLSLRPGETVSATIWADGGEMGALLDLHAGSALALRWGVLQGFRMDIDKIFQPGPMCLNSETNIQSRRYTGDPNQPDEDAVAAIGSLRGAPLCETLLFVAWRFRMIEQEEADRTFAKMTPEERATKEGTEAAIRAGKLRAVERRRPIVEAIATRLASWSAEERLFAFLVILPAQKVPGCEPIDEAARTETDPAARLVALLTRAGEADDPLFDEIIASGDETAREFALLLRARRVLDSEESDRQAKERQEALSEPE